MHTNYNGTAITNASGTDISGNASHIANINPFRYRGYYYDTETGFYYLQTRYYDPVVGRFLSSDIYASTGQGVLGNNMFAYCNNNPILLIDPEGEFGILTMCLIGACVGLVSTYAGDVVDNYKKGERGADMFKPTSSLGDYTVSALSGAASAWCPAAGIAADVAGPLVGKGVDSAVDYLKDGEINEVSYSLGEYALDVGGNLLCSAFTSSIEMKMPNFIRDIKDDALSAGLKGSNAYDAYLERQRILRFSHNQATGAFYSFQTDRIFDSFKES